MSGGISQLVATGAQDVHLVGDPQVSFFRSNYKRHTNFSAVKARQVIQGNVQAGGMSTVRFEKKGDLLSYTYLTKHARTAVHRRPSATAISRTLSFTLEASSSTRSIRIIPTPSGLRLEANSYSKAAGPTTNFYPLHFFFCDNWTNALPLVALQYHDVEIRIYWASPSPASTHTYQTWSNFIYLDEAERTYFAENTQNMLIKQVQRSRASGKSVQSFNFNHPVLYIGSQSDTSNYD